MSEWGAEMSGLDPLGRILVIIGGTLLLLGLVLILAGRISWVGRLPGDIRIEGEHFSFYFPIVTCVLLSILLTLILNLIARILRR
ncbi:MAG: DUF2905 domain-containing protein [Chloroflexota bacterium]|nr:DUF2905 domain-containing protein [Chloroflexota bacterium]